MLEESPDDRAHLDVIGDPGDAGTQRAHAAHDQVDAHAGARGPIQTLDGLWIHQGVELGDDAPALAGAGVCALALDQRVQGFLQLEGRLQQPAQARCLREAGELQEDLMHVVADGLIAR